MGHPGIQGVAEVVTVVVTAGGGGVGAVTGFQAVTGGLGAHVVTCSLPKIHHPRGLAWFPEIVPGVQCFCRTAISICGVVGWTTSYTSSPISASRARNRSAQPQMCIMVFAP